MKSQIENQKPTNDNDVNNIVESYMKRQAWMATFINPKNKIYNVKPS